MVLADLVVGGAVRLAVTAVLAGVALAALTPPPALDLPVPASRQPVAEALGWPATDPVVAPRLVLLSRFADPGDRRDDATLLRAALVAGLHRADPIARERLAQRASSIPTPDPGDAVLTAWLADHAQHFTPPPVITFQEVYVAPSPDADARVEALVRDLRAGADPTPLGDPNLTRRPTRTATSRDLMRSHGEPVGVALASLPLDTWTALPGRDGHHLVRVTARTTPTAPVLATIREAVLADWRASR